MAIEYREHLKLRPIVYIGSLVTLLSKTLFYILILTILSCNQQAKQTDTKFSADTTQHAPATRLVDNSKYHTLKDSLMFVIETGDTLRYSKEKFNQIVDRHPEFFGDHVKDPDQTFNCCMDKDGFSSEVGQDEYYVLYAYFLKQRNGVDKYAERRKRLIEIYNNINFLFERFQHGGTYFGHQARRILAHAEYSIYLYKGNEYHLSKTYNVAGQKDIYVKLLRQLIDDEISIDFDIMGNEKTKRRKELNQVVDNIDRMISDYFYLTQAQGFQFEHYQYF